MEHNLFALWHYVAEPRHAKRAVNRSSFTPKPRAEQMPGPARLSVPVFRQKTCAKAKGGCGEKFKPARAMQMACSPDCAWSMARHEGAKKAAVLARDDKARTRVALEGMKKLSELRAEAQDAFNAFIKLRDRIAGHGCICCGKPLNWNSGIPGGLIDAGHFISRGSAPELAFVETNVSAQLKSCNRAGGTTRAKFKAGMIARWGEAVVAALEGPHPTPHLKHDDYRRLRAHYRAEAARLRKGME